MAPPRRLVLLCVLLARPGAAAAQPAASPPSREAARHREAGYSAFDLGDYDAAVREFQAAYRVEPDPRLLYNLGLSYRKRFQVTRGRGDLIRARDAFQHFLTLVSPDDPRFAADRQWLDQVRTLAIQYRKEMERELAARDASRPDLVGTSRPATPPRPRRRLAGTLLVVGAVALASAAVTGYLAWRAAQRVEDLDAQGDHLAANTQANRSDALALTTDILAAAGGLTVGVGVLLWIRRSGDQPDAAPAPAKRAGVGATLSVRF